MENLMETAIFYTLTIAWFAMLYRIVSDTEDRR
jgi:hypothetical protein